MGELVSTLLGKLCRFQAGDAFKKDLQGRDYGDFPFVKVSDMNIAGNEIYVRRSINWVSKTDVDNQKYHIHQPGAVIFAKIGVALTYNRRRIVVIPTIIDNNMMAAEPNHDTIDSIYFYYLLSTIDFNKVSSGSALPYLTQNDLLKIHVYIHSREEQTEIAKLLGALDDKIDLNRQTNETLETLARAIFKDWFMDFGPTRAKSEGREPYLAKELWELFPERIDDETGLPVGWKEICLKDLGEVVTGKTPSTINADYFGGVVPFLKIPDMHHKLYVIETSSTLSLKGAKSQIKKTIPAGSISVSCIATPGLVILNHKEIQTNQQINSLIPSVPEQSLFAFWSCRQLAADVMLGGSGGSVFHNMNKTSFENLKVLFPGDQLAGVFSNTVSSLHDRILANEYEGKALAQTRDLLLPKLISGEIRLKDAERIVGEVV